jgi:hypothetical protein
MVRTKTTTLALALFVAPLLTLFVSACGGGGGEQTLIRNYFTASRVGDRATLGNIAMVGWNTREDGSVSSPSVESVTEEQSRPLRLKELNQALLDASASDEEFSARKLEYQTENFDAINRVLEAERDSNDVAQRDAEVQEAWTTWRNETMEHSKMSSDADAELRAEQNAAGLSVFDPNNPLDLTQFDGQLLTKDAQVTATVELDGVESERTMTVTFQKAVLTGADGTEIEGRWVIANIN